MTGVGRLLVATLTLLFIAVVLGHLSDQLLGREAGTSVVYIVAGFLGVIIVFAMRLLIDRKRHRSTRSDAAAGSTSQRDS
jgi:putative effector of murein hydrolase LrgA (UPF0299 family)